MYRLAKLDVTAIQRSDSPPTRQPETETMNITYTTDGSVRGTCGHKHRTVEAAYKCLEEDQQGCESQGGYSDRHVEQTDGDDLTDSA